MGPERSYYESIHRKLSRELHREKMHNAFRGGTPDVWYSGTADDLWVEYKWYPHKPGALGLKVSALLSPLQVLWLTQRQREGRNVAVIVGSPSGAAIVEKGWDTTVLNADDLCLMREHVAEYLWQRTMITSSA